MRPAAGLWSSSVCSRKTESKASLTVSLCIWPVRFVMQTEPRMQELQVHRWKGYGRYQETESFQWGVQPLYTPLTKYPLKREAGHRLMTGIVMLGWKGQRCVNVNHLSCCNASSSTWSPVHGTSEWPRSRSSHHQCAVPSQSPISGNVGGREQSLQQNIHSFCLLP